MKRVIKHASALFVWLSIGLIAMFANATAYNNGVEVGSSTSAVSAETVTVESTSIDDSTSEYGVLAHDGSDLTVTNNKGGIKLKTAAQKAQGTMTLSGQPSAAETFVINATTVTARASGATTDEFNIGATVPATLANIAAAVNAGTEAANVTAWVDSATTVIFEWNTAGTAGNSIVFTEAMSNTIIDGAGTLGATNLGAAAATLIDADHSTGGIQILPNAGGITKIGDATTAGNLGTPTNDDAHITGRLEVDGNLYSDSSLYLGGGVNLANNFGISFGAADGNLLFRTGQTPDTIALGVGALSNHILIMEKADTNVDMAHAQQTNPTVFIHSADATDTTDWISLAHNQTSAVIGSGNGGVQIASRLQGLQGADVASANDITLTTGNYFDITGTTEIQRILGTGWIAGSIVTLQFDASVQVTHGTAAGTGYFGIQLSGAGNMSATAGDTLQLVFDGAWWREVSRTVI